MGENHIGDLNVGKMTTAIPDSSNDFDPWPDQDKKWGLSFLINTQRTPEGRSPGSLAWAGLANTYFWIDPARDVGGVIMMQLLPFVDRKAIELYGALERGVYAQPGWVAEGGVTRRTRHRTVPGRGRASAGDARSRIRDLPLATPPRTTLAGSAALRPLNRADARLLTSRWKSSSA